MPLCCAGPAACSVALEVDSKWGPFSNWSMLRVDQVRHTVRREGVQWGQEEPF